MKKIKYGLNRTRYKKTSNTFVEQGLYMIKLRCLNIFACIIIKLKFKKSVYGLKYLPC